MIPEQRLSTTPRTAPLLPPDDETRTPTYVRKNGGVRLNDPSLGLTYQKWTLTTDGVDVSISAPNHAQSVLFSGSDISDIDLAFDQNMRPFVTFFDGGSAKYRWYDTQAERQVISTLPGATSMRCCMDDKRQMQTGSSDVILTYVKDGNLYFRAQRDRYGVEYMLKSSVGGRVDKVGMGRNGRLHFSIRAAA